MPSIYVDLQEGFSEDLIIIKVNGNEVWRKEKIKTRMQIGLAEPQLKFDVDQYPVKLEIILPSKNIKKQIEFLSSDSPYVGVSVVNNEITYRTSDTPFGYA